MAQRVYVSSTKLLTYGSLGPVSLGQVFETQGLLNDEKLLAPHIGYLKPVEDPSEIDSCISCGREFINTNYRQQHQAAAQHEALDLDKPIRRSRQRQVNAVNINPDGNDDLKLEPEGAPTAPPPSSSNLVGTDRGAIQKGKGEVFRIGGGRPVGV